MNPPSNRPRRFHQTAYQAGSWSKARKIIARAEATGMGSDVRFVVTNLPGSAKVLYEKVYCARGRMENMIKDMKLYTRSDRTSCHRWEANQFRLILHMAAYWLLHALQGRRAQALAMAHGDFRDAAARLSQNRGARGGTEKPNQGRLPLSLSARAGARSPRRNQ